MESLPGKKIMPLRQSLTISVNSPSHPLMTFLRIPYHTEVKISGLHWKQGGRKVQFRHWKIYSVSNLLWWNNKHPTKNTHPNANYTISNVENGIRYHYKSALLEGFILFPFYPHKNPLLNISVLHILQNYKCVIA